MFAVAIAALATIGLTEITLLLRRTGTARMVGLSLTWFALGCVAYLSHSTALVLAGGFADGAGLVSYLSYRAMLLAVIAVVGACAAVALIRPAPEPPADAAQEPEPEGAPAAATMITES